MSNTSLLGSFGGQAGDGLMFRNRIINGDMRIDQRNAGAAVTITTSGVYTLDRWCVGNTQASKFKVEQSATAPAGFANSMLLTSLSAYSVGAADTFFVQQYIEGFNTADFMFGTASAQVVSLSFWVRSSLTGTFGGSIGNNSANYAYPFTYSISAANTWEQKTISIPGAIAGTWVGSTNGRGMRVVFNLGSGANFSGTANTWQVAGASNELYAPTGATSLVGTNGATLYITGVQLEAGPTATPFERRPIGVETALAQRYCALVASNNIIGIAQATSATGAYINFSLPTSMRATPAISFLSGTFANCALIGGGGAQTVLNGNPSIASCVGNFVLGSATTASGLTTGQMYQFIVNTATLVISAEL